MMENMKTAMLCCLRATSFILFHEHWKVLEAASILILAKIGSFPGGAPTTPTRLLTKHDIQIYFLTTHI